MANLALGNQAEAAQAFKKVCELQPMNGIAFYQLGMAQHQCADAEALSKTAARLAEFDPKHTRMLVQDSGRSDLQHLLLMIVAGWMALLLPAVFISSFKHAAHQSRHWVAA